MNSKIKDIFLKCFFEADFLTAEELLNLSDFIWEEEEDYERS